MCKRLSIERCRIVSCLREEVDTDQSICSHLGVTRIFDKETKKGLWLSISMHYP